MALTPQQHERSATIKPKTGYPRGRFPMPNPEHAKLALEALNGGGRMHKAKNVSPAEASAVRARANRILAAGKAAQS